MECIEKVVIDTIRYIGYDEIEKKNISRNDILYIVSRNTGILRNDIKKICNYKEIIDEEFSKMRNEKLSKSNDELLNIVLCKIKDLKLPYKSDDEPLNVVLDKLKELKLPSEYNNFKYSQTLSF